MYTITNTEKNNEKASEYETFSLLYLLGVRSDKNDIDIVLIDCFNDVTGTNDQVNRLWDVQSKGRKSNTPLQIGKHLITLYANSLSDFPFSHLILFLETVDSSYVVDDSQRYFGFSNFTQASKIKIFDGLRKEAEKPKISTNAHHSDQSMYAFLDKVDFAICLRDKAVNVKSLIEFKNKELHPDELFENIFNEIRDRQTALKNLNLENTQLANPSDILAFKKYISKDQVITLVINRLVGIDLFNNLSIPIYFSPYTQSLHPEDIRDLIQECNASVCRTFFNKNNKVYVWELLESVIKLVMSNSQSSVEELFTSIPENLRKKVPTLDDISTKFFIARVKDGLS